MKNSGDNVFQGIPVGEQEQSFVAAFLASHDLAAESQRAFLGDIKKFARWFTTANKERFCVQRVTTRDIADFRDSLRREQGQAVATSIERWSWFGGSSTGWPNTATSHTTPPRS